MKINIYVLIETNNSKIRNIYYDDKLNIFPKIIFLQNLNAKVDHKIIIDDVDKIYLYYYINTLLLYCCYLIYYKYVGHRFADALCTIWKVNTTSMMCVIYIYNQTNYMSCNYDEYSSNLKVSYGVYNNLIIDCIYYLKCYSFCTIFRCGVHLLCNLFISTQYKYG